MKRCGYCFKDNDNSSEYCIRCGRPLIVSSRRAHQNPREPRLRTEASLVISRGPALLVAAALLLGWGLVLAEHFRLSSAERRYAELQGQQAAQEERVAAAEEKARQEREKEKAQRSIALGLATQLDQLRSELAAAQEEKAQLAKNRASVSVPAKPSPLTPIPYLKPLTRILPQPLPELRPIAMEGPLPTDFRLGHGTVLQQINGQGRGKLEVINQRASDAVIKLVSRRNNQCVAAFYVQASQSYTLPGVPDGSYTLYFATGYNYDPTSQGFTRAQRASRCASSFEFTTTDYPDRIESTRQRFTLGATFGNVSSTPVSDREFDGYRAPQ